MNNSRSRRASTKLVTAATKAAVLQTSPQFAKKFASTVEKVNKSDRKTARDTSQKEVVKEKDAKKTIIPEERTCCFLYLKHGTYISYHLI